MQLRVVAISFVVLAAVGTWTLLANGENAPESGQVNSRDKRQIWRDETVKIKPGHKEASGEVSVGEHADEAVEAPVRLPHQKPHRGRGGARRPSAQYKAAPVVKQQLQGGYADEYHNAVAAPQPAAYYDGDAPYDAGNKDDGYGSRKPILINTQPAAQSGYKPRPAYEEYGDSGLHAAASNKRPTYSTDAGYKRDDGGYGDKQDIPGTPGVDYPVYHSPPDTNFDCSAVNVRPGMYADIDTGCQVYRICDDGRHGKGGAAFLCTNGTIFNQAEFTCDWWYNVDCKHAADLYRLNEDPYQNPFYKNDYLKKDEADSYKKAAPAQQDYSAYAPAANPAPYYQEQQYRN